MRVGIVVDALTVPAWVARVVRDVRESGLATLEVVIVAPPETREPLPLLYRLYAALDARKFAPRPDPLAPAPLAPLIDGVPIETGLERARGYQLDVVVHFGTRPLDAAALDLARHGVWAYHHGDDRTLRGGPPGFWEVMERRGVTGTALRVLDDSPDGGRVIYRSSSTTHPISVRANQAHAWKSSTFVLRALRALHRDGPGALADPEPLRPYAGRRYTTPGNCEMAGLLARLGARYVMRHLRERLEARRWTLAYHFGTPSPAGKDAVPDLVPQRFRELTPPRGHVWADPFPVQVDGRYFVFFEDCPPETNRGRIAFVEIAPDGHIAAPVPVIERDYHLSYPFVFEWQGAHYMIPESSANGTVDLYRATRFPSEWTWERTLLDGAPYVDATLAEIGGRWWMFANRPAVLDALYESCYWDELHLFVADSPLGPWTPHRRNPVVSDVRRARPAGRLFQHDGVWYRPAQNSAALYGASLSVQRITRIDADAYEETEAAVLTPSWRPGISGVHTINAAGGLTLIDVAVRRRRWNMGGSGRPPSPPASAPPA